MTLMLFSLGLTVVAICVIKPSKSTGDAIGNAGCIVAGFAAAAGAIWLNHLGA